MMRTGPQFAQTKIGADSLSIPTPIAALPTRLSWIGSLVLALASVVLLCVYGFYQPRLDGDKGVNDGAFYFEVAQEIQDSGHPASVAPFTYRAGTPLLAAITATVFRVDLVQAFFLVNAAGAVLAVVLFFQFLRPYLPPLLATVITMLWALMWHSPPRYTVMLAVNVNSWFMVFWLAGLILIDRPRTAPNVLMLAIVTLIGILFRETALFIPLVILLSGRIGRLILLRLWRLLTNGRAFTQLGSRQDYIDFGKGLVVLFAALLAIWLTHAWSEPVTNRFNFILQALESLGGVTLLAAIAAILLAFGPLILLPLLSRKPSLTHLAKHQAHLTALAIILLASLLGGSDTVRYLSWAGPIVFLLAALTIRELANQIPQSIPHRIAWELFASLLAIAQLVACLVLTSLSLDLEIVLGSRDELPWRAGLFTVGVYFLLYLVLLLLLRLATRPRTASPV